MVRRIGLVSAVMGVALLGAAASASAGALDQQQTSSNNNVGIFSFQSAAQTFTAGKTGVLDQADLLLSTLTPIPEPLTVEIRNTSAGIPGTSVLASGSIPNSAIGPNPPAFVSVTFAAPAAVTAGTQYALVAYTTHTDNDALGWFYKDADPYSGGGEFSTGDTDHPQEDWFEQAGDDMAFKTYVGPPPAPPSPPATTVQPVLKKKCKKKHKKHSAQSAKKKHCKKKRKK